MASGVKRSSILAPGYRRAFILPTHFSRPVTERLPSIESETHSQRNDESRLVRKEPSYETFLKYLITRTVSLIGCRQLCGPEDDLDAFR